MSSQAVVSATNHEVSGNKRSNNCASPTSQITDLEDSSLQKNCEEQSFNNSANLTNNSSGLGDSISMPCLLNECDSSSSSVYDGSNTVNNVVYSSSGSLPETPTSSNTSGIDFSKINSDATSNQKDFPKSDVYALKSEFSSRSDYSPLKNAQFGNSLGQQLNSLNLNEVDYSPFNDYMGIDKMILQMAVADGQKSKGNFNLDPQQQQQIIAQALAAVASNNSSGNSETSNKSQSRSITENIELLNSKLLSHKSQNNSSDKYSDNMSVNSINGPQNNQNNIQNNSDSYLGYNSPNLPVNLKRQSYPQANQNSNGHMFASTTTSNNIHSLLNSGSSSVQPGMNNRLNSNSLVNEHQASNKYPQSHDKQVSGSLSASNSSFNFNVNGNNDVELSSRNNLSNFSGNNSNCYDDDDVFSSNNSFNSSLNQSIRSENNNQSNNSNLDTVALAQLYRSFLNNGSNNNNNNNSSNRNDNMNELLSTYNSNLTALSLNPDLINSNSFLNSTNSIANQLKSMSNNSSNSGNNANYSNNKNSNSNIDQIAAALLKQRQNLLHANRSSSSSINNSSTNNPSSNIAALTSATSNIASLLNLNNNSSQQNSQHFQQVFGDQKRRMNSNTNVAGNGNNNLGSIYSNNSLFNTNVGPNASHLLQNSSLASSARLNSATSSSAAASVLGNNSTLHALSSLQHQSNSGNLNNSQNNHQSIFNSNSNNNVNNGSNMQHQSNLLNFNMSPSSASNHGILSALSLSSTAGNSLQNQLLSASGKPLRSERLPSHYVEEIVKQAKIRRRNGGKKEVCVFCRNNGEKEQIYTSHTLKDASNHVACPILRQYQCPICRASGDNAHTIKYCPYAEKDSNCIKLFKENGRMSAAAALLMNSLAGGNNSPHSLSPPSTPPPSHSSHSLMHQNLNSLEVQSPSHHSSLNAYLNSSLNFDLSASKNETGSSLNKSFSSNCSSMLNSAQNSNYAKPTTNSLLTSRDSNSSLLTSNFSNNLNK